MGVAPGDRLVCSHHRYADLLSLNQNYCIPRIRCPNACPITSAGGKPYSTGDKLVHTCIFCLKYFCLICTHTSAAFPCDACEIDLPIGRPLQVTLMEWEVPEDQITNQLLYILYEKYHVQLFQLMVRRLSIEQLKEILKITNLREIQGGTWKTNLGSDHLYTARRRTPGETFMLIAQEHATEMHTLVIEYTWRISIHPTLRMYAHLLPRNLQEMYKPHIITQNYISYKQKYPSELATPSICVLAEDGDVNPILSSSHARTLGGTNAGSEQRPVPLPPISVMFEKLPIPQNVMTVGQGSLSGRGAGGTEQKEMNQENSTGESAGVTGGRSLAKSKAQKQLITFGELSRPSSKEEGWDNDLQMDSFLRALEVIVREVKGSSGTTGANPRNPQ